MKQAALVQNLTKILGKQHSIEFSLLFGSYARGDFHDASDLDIAVNFVSDLKQDDTLVFKEKLKNFIKKQLNFPGINIEIIDIQKTALSLSSTIVEEGIVLTGENSLFLSRFYLRTWAHEEDFYWRLHNENRALSS